MKTHLCERVDLHSARVLIHLNCVYLYPLHPKYVTHWSHGWSCLHITSDTRSQWKQLYRFCSVYLQGAASIGKPHLKLQQCGSRIFLILGIPFNDVMFSKRLDLGFLVSGLNWENNWCWEPQPWSCTIQNDFSCAQCTIQNDFSCAQCTIQNDFSCAQFNFSTIQNDFSCAQFKMISAVHNSKWFQLCII